MIKLVSASTEKLYNLREEEEMRVRLSFRIISISLFIFLPWDFERIPAISKMDRFPVNRFITSVKLSFSFFCAASLE